MGALTVLRSFWFGHQLLDEMLGFVIGTFAYVLIANIPLFVDEVARGPITLLVGAPSRAFVVKGDCIIDFKFDGGLQNVFDFFLVAELGVMNADDGEIVPSYFSYHSLTQGITRLQLIQPNVQNSSRTTLPCTSARRNGRSVFSQTSLFQSGAGPRTGKGDGVGSAWGTAVSCSWPVDAGSGIAVAVQAVATNTISKSRERLIKASLFWAKAASLSAKAGSFLFCDI